MSRIVFSEDPQRTFERIRKKYQEHRTYHGLKHIEACLDELRKYRRWAWKHHGFQDGYLLVEIALWFHDLIYNPHRKDNEERSAEAFDGWLGHNLNADARKTIRRLILATKHSHQPRTQYEKLVVDIDLSILGQNRKIFDAYERAIRKEYAFVPDEEFRHGRKAVLMHLLERRKIYSTPYFRRLYEFRARTNLKRSIKRLS